MDAEKYHLFSEIIQTKKKFVKLTLKISISSVQLIDSESGVWHFHPLIVVFLCFSDKDNMYNFITACIIRLYILYAFLLFLISSTWC